MPPQLSPLLQLGILALAVLLYLLARYGLPQPGDLQLVVDWLAQRIGRGRAQLQRVAQAMVPAPDPTGGRVIDGKIAHRSWEGLVNRQPDRYPHLLIVGPTGAGKTTFTRAVLATRTGAAVVLTPKPDPNDWPGVPIITIDDSGEFGELTAAFGSLQAELRRRLVAAKRGAHPGEPLTIVCDDWPVLVSECGKVAGSVFKIVARLGRSLRVRLIILSQSERVKSLGLDGEGDAVANFARIDLGRGHTATWVTDHALPLDTRMVPLLAAQAQPATRWWVPEPVPLVPDGAILADLLVPGNRFPTTADLVPGGSRAAEPVPTMPEPVPDPEADKIRALADQGWSRNQIAGELGGRRGDALERIRRVLG